MKTVREWEAWFENGIDDGSLKVQTGVGYLVEAVREEMRKAIRDHLRQRGFNADRDGLPTYGRHLLESAVIVENFGKDATVTPDVWSKCCDLWDRGHRGGCPGAKP